MAAVPSIGRASFVEAPRVAPEAVATQGLYERHAAKIQSYCMHQLGSREEAEDAVQTTFMNAFRALGRGVVPEAESAWLFKIAENVCLSRRRSSWRRGRIESPSDFGVIEEIVPGPSGQRDELIGIEDALASMPEQQRRAILLREWQGLSYREVAAELEVSQSAVETLIFRARRSLAQGLEQPDSIKPAKRKSFRRALHALDLGTVLAAAKTLLAGSAAVKATAAAVAVTAVAGTAATVVPKLETKAPDKAPATALMAPAAAEPSSSSRSFAPSAAGTAAAASKPLAIAALRPGTQMPARAVVSRSASPRGVPAAPAPVPAVPAAPTAETRVAQPVEPVQVEQPTVEPTPAPAAEQPQHEERKHETTPPAAAPAKRTDEGRQVGENRAGNSTEPVAPTQQPVAAALEELKRRIGKGRHDERHNPPAAEVPTPSSVTAPAPEQTEPEEQKGEGKKERWKGNGRRDNDRRDLAVPPVISDPAPTPVLDAPAPTPAEQPAAAAAPASVPEQRLGEGDKGNRSGRRKGK